MSLWALVVLLAGTALAEPCPGRAGEPCTPSATEKQKIIDLLNEAYAIETAMKDAAEERKSSAARGDYEETWRLTQVIELNEEIMNKKLASALAETEKAYNIGPRNPAGSVALPKDPLGRGEWAVGIPVFWAPKVRYELAEIRKIAAPDGSLHYIDGTVDPRKTAGVTYPDGEVRILVQNLHDARATGNPGLIAYILHHEARHFDDIVTHGQGGRVQDELRAYTDSVRDADIFELPETEKNRLKELKNENLTRARAGAPTSFFPDAREEQDLSMAYDAAQRQLRLYESRRDSIRRQGVEAQRNRLAREAHARVMGEYQGAASGCGLTPIMTQGDTTLGFKAGESVNVYFTEPVTLAQAKAGLLMTRACVMGEWGRAEEQPCTEAIGLMGIGWADPGFRHGLELDADAGNIDGCLRAIREEPAPPKDMKALNKRVSKYWRDWSVAAKRREMETMRELRRGQEESSRRARGDAEERSGRVPDQSYDLTPARRALDEARRSRF